MILLLTRIWPQTLSLKRMLKNKQFFVIKSKKNLKKSKLKILFKATLQSHIDIMMRQPKVWFGSFSST